MTLMARIFSVLAIFSMVSAVQYCAHFPGDDGFVIGYYKMSVQSGRASHSFQLDLSNFKDTSECDLSNGLYYHVHTSWNPDDSTRTSGLGATDCGATVTGGHYDPNLACSASSQDASGLCVALNRTSALGYTYNCTSAGFAAGIVSHCEVGDLSGKFGIVYPRYGTGACGSHFCRRMGSCAANLLLPPRTTRPPPLPAPTTSSRNRRRRTLTSW